MVSRLVGKKVLSLIANTLQSIHYNLAVWGGGGGGSEHSEIIINQIYGSLAVVCLDHLQLVVINIANYQPHLLVAIWDYGGGGGGGGGAPTLRPYWHHMQPRYTVSQTVKTLLLLSDWH